MRAGTTTIAACMALAAGLACSGGWALASGSARDWIATTSERDGIWRDHGIADFPSGRIFVGDPTWGDATHLRGARPLDAEALRVWSYGDGMAGANYALWLEAAGTLPETRRETLDFGIDAATLALGDHAAGQALVDLGNSMIRAGEGDSFDWISPHIQKSQYVANWVVIPPGQHSLFLASTNNDGGYKAVWVYDGAGGLSGILIDFSGRKSDLTFLDVLLQDTQ